MELTGHGEFTPIKLRASATQSDGLTDYERGLRDAAAICRQEAKSCVPFRTIGYVAHGRIFGRQKSIGKSRQAQMAVRCARAIEKLIVK